MNCKGPINIIVHDENQRSNRSTNQSVGYCRSRKTRSRSPVSMTGRSVAILQSNKALHHRLLCGQISMQTQNYNHGKYY